MKRLLVALGAVAVWGTACGGRTTASSDAGGTAPSSSGTCLGWNCQTASGATSGASSGVSSEVPLYHRPDDSQCSEPAPPGDCPVGSALLDGSVEGGPGAQPCGQDSQCTAGSNGRCIRGPAPTGTACTCTYDACTHDTDCPSGELCVCHGSGYSVPFCGAAGAYEEARLSNRCGPGNCRVDSDCSPQGYCSPSPGYPCAGLSGYYCHTPWDTCADDLDCAGYSTENVPGGINVCTWSSTDGFWVCTVSPGGS